MIWRRAVAAILMGAAMTQPVQSETRVQVANFDQLDGWANDDHAAALSTFKNTCQDLRDPDWRALCALAAQNPEPRAFFELFFRPVLIEDGKDGLFNAALSLSCLCHAARGAGDTPVAQPSRYSGRGHHGRAGAGNCLGR